MNKEVLVIIITIITLVVSVPLSSAAVVTAQEHEKFFMSLKLANPQPNPYYNNATNYDTSDIMSNNLNKSFLG
jgi:hypothetical protein